jgi:hypothetical protein
MRASPISVRARIRAPGFPSDTVTRLRLDHAESGREGKRECKTARETILGTKSVGGYVTPPPPLAEKDCLFRVEGFE